MNRLGPNIARADESPEFLGICERDLGPLRTAQGRLLRSGPDDDLAASARVVLELSTVLKGRRSFSS